MTSARALLGHPSRLEAPRALLIMGVTLVGRQ
jgi:hypothetical protein